MICSNVKIFEGVSFEDYLKLPGLSYSGIKNADKQIGVTDKMMFGKRVDAYLFTPEDYDGTDYDLVKPVAIELKRFLGEALQYGKSQLSVTCNMIHEDLFIQYKGRPDFIIRDILIDLKVSEMNPFYAAQFFRYDWQLSGYAAPLKSKVAFIISIHPKTKKISTIPIKFVYDWWEFQIKQWGKPINGLLDTL